MHIFSSGISSRSCSALLLDGWTSVYDHPREWDGMLEWDQVSKEGGSRQHWFKLFREPQRKDLGVFCGHQMSAACYCCTPE